MRSIRDGQRWRRFRDGAIVTIVDADEIGRFLNPSVEYRSTRRVWKMASAFSVKYDPADTTPES